MIIVILDLIAIALILSGQVVLYKREKRFIYSNDPKNIVTTILILLGTVIGLLSRILDPTTTAIRFTLWSVFILVQAADLISKLARRRQI